jgi:mannan endo-1,4-beta-mannosidase
MKSHFVKLIFLFSIFSILSVPSYGQGITVEPVTKKATPEARALLKYIQGLRGNYILPGQHNFPISGDRNSQFAADYIGKTPPVWSQDFGFSEEGDKDSYLARPDIIREAIRQHKAGAIINLCWHAVPPTAEEPVTFQPLPGYDSTALASVQGQLLDQQFKDVLTPGTALHKQWLKQVDEIASFLKQLQDANVPVLWRPYHEMNGDWFWWGGRYEGKYTTAALYRQIFDRMVKHHKLTNLLWVWSVDRPSQPGREFVNYFPGTEYLDVLSLDVYGNDFKQSYYDDLMELSKDKPLVLGEVGNPPSTEIIEKQPNWVYWVVWSGMVRGTSNADYDKLLAHPRVIFMEDQEYIDGTSAFREACGFGPIVVDRTANFTGTWVLSDIESELQSSSPVNPPYKLQIEQGENTLKIKSSSIVEWADDEVTELELSLDGEDVKSTIFQNAPRIQNAAWNPAKDTLIIDSSIKFEFGERPMEIKSKEVWNLSARGKKLVIKQTSNGFMGRGGGTSIMVYYKQ